MFPYKKMIFKVLCGFFATLSTFASAQILTNGKWVQLEFKQTAVYKITYNDLKNYGFDINSVNPKNLHFYTVQGNQLSLLNTSIKQSCNEIPIESTFLI